MTTESLHIGQRVRHPAHGTGTVKAINELAAEIAFDDGQRRTIAPETSGLAPAEATATLTGLDVPLAALLRDMAEATVKAMGWERPGEVVRLLANRWRGGKLVLHPADPTLQTKEVELETFFHKIVMVRNNLRVLEQKINAHESLSSAEKFDWQQYITRCYGSLTTFNVLFKEKDEQF
ncbi:MAG: hypothetical protein IPM17_06900 [Verrucomicrobia bacterium]|nr:hypothetical protein [Verrucomicrobiota bacterium]